MQERKIRVLLLNDHLGWGNQIHGVARLFLQWACHLDRRRCEVTVCILREKTPLSRPFEQRGVDIVFLGKRRYDPTTLFSLLRLVRRRRIDILHVQSYGAITFGKLVGRLTGRPVLVHFHDTTDFYPLAQRISDRLLGRMADAYLAVSASARDCWARRCRLDPPRVSVLYNCASLEEFRPPTAQAVAERRRALGIPDGWRVVGTVTRLFAVKGTRYLLQAVPAVLRAFPDTMFVIVGDGPERQSLEALAGRLGIGRHVVFTGYTDQVPGVLGTFDLQVITSYAAEGGSPLPVIEAWAMGKPVIVTDVVEIVEDGRTGVVIPPRDAARLAEKIIELLADPGAARRLAENALRAARDHDTRCYLQRLEACYRSLLAGRERRRR